MAKSVPTRDPSWIAVTAALAAGAAAARVTTVAGRSAPDRASGHAAAPFQVTSHLEQQCVFNPGERSAPESRNDDEEYFAFFDEK
ncbi:MAG: hypothetical protein ACFCGT_11500 [Sandaracinaceae bacterium]